MSKKIIRVSLTVEFPMNESGIAEKVYSLFSDYFNDLRMKTYAQETMLKGGTGYQITTVSDTYPKDVCWECEKDLDKPKG